MNASTSERSTNEAVVRAKNMKGAAVVIWEERREPCEAKKRRTGGIVSGAFIGENMILSEGSSNTAAVVGTVTGKRRRGKLVGAVVGMNVTFTNMCSHQAIRDWCRFTNFWRKDEIYVQNTRKNARSL